MRYNNIAHAVFKNRPNRFTAEVEIDGRTETVHVKNTGRCRELLIPGADIYIEKSNNRNRSTAYDLVSVYKGKRLINMDSGAPNKAVGEWLEQGGLIPGLTLVQPEKKYKNSRFDFYAETPTKKIFIEVKGVTLEEGNTAMFPDAPSLRAVKHVKELIEARREGYEAYVIFVIQMPGTDFFMPNRNTHPEFAQVLRQADEEGVHIAAYECLVEPDRMEIGGRVPVLLHETAGIGGPLLEWYDRTARVLPWRQEPEAYHVWVSEIMLQQTRVEAVKPYYDRFLDALPDIGALAGAQEQELLKLWEGLGYYNRVRNMQKAARIVMEEHGGRLPDTYEGLMKLPGIGPYTAGAVASIAYGRRTPAVDGNVLRVLSRLTADSGDIQNAQVRKRMEALAFMAMPPERPGDFNQAMMELGAMVCIPNGRAKCGECPLRRFCRAHAEDRVMEFPVKAGKQERKTEKKTVLVIRLGDKVMLHKRPDRGLLAGMYEFPMLDGHKTAAAVRRHVQTLGIQPVKVSRLAGSRHIFTHKEWEMIGYEVSVQAVVTDTEKDFVLAEPWEFREKYPIPSAFAVYAKSIERGDREL